MPITEEQLAAWEAVVSCKNPVVTPDDVLTLIAEVRRLKAGQEIMLAKVAEDYCPKNAYKDEYQGECDKYHDCASCWRAYLDTLEVTK